jgi:hypothetical protein
MFGIFTRPKKSLMIFFGKILCLLVIDLSLRYFENACKAWDVDILVSRYQYLVVRCPANQIELDS